MPEEIARIAALLVSGNGEGAEALALVARVDGAGTLVDRVRPAFLPRDDLPDYGDAGICNEMVIDLLAGHVCAAVTCAVRESGDPRARGPG